jgi:hypothetical protein
MGAIRLAGMGTLIQSLPTESAPGSGECSMHGLSMPSFHLTGQPRMVHLPRSVMGIIMRHLNLARQGVVVYSRLTCSRSTYVCY